MQPCTNTKCNNQEATPVLEFNGVVFYICEKCGKRFTIGDQGFASEEEIKLLQSNQFQQIARTGRYKPFRLREYIGNINANVNIIKGDSIILRNPMNEREWPGVKRASM